MTESVGDRSRQQYNKRETSFSKCVSLGLKTTESYLNNHFNHITVPCHSQLFQSSRMPPSSATSSLCSAPVVQALRSRDQTWQCNSTGEGRK